MSEWLIDRDIMTQEQIALLDEQGLNERLLVTGPPGSGKTIMALHLARKLSATRGKNSVLFLVFTNVLKAFIETGIQELGLSQECVALAYSWYNNNRKECKFIIVDEAQDFCLNEKQAEETGFRSGSIKEIHHKATEGMVIFADFSQRVYNNRDWEYCDLVKMISPPPVLKQFRQNFRMPEKIGKVAANLLEPDEGRNLVRRCMNKDASAVVMAIRCSSIDTKADCIARLIKNSGLSEVCIIVHTKESGICLYQALNTLGIACEAYIRQFVDTIDFASSNPKILTYQSAKGLQFHTVIIAFGECEPHIPKQLFVGLTRAKKQLFVLYQNKLCESLHDISEEILPRKNWRG